MIRLSTRRPVAVAMAYFAVALLGVAAWRNIPIELLPDASLPRLSVNTSWRGASPETIEAFLTSPIESTIQQVRGVERVTSTTSEGSSAIDVEFARDTDMDFARLDLSERLATLQEDLPPGVGAVTVSPYVPQQFSGQANRALLLYTLTGPYTLEALRSFVDDRIEPELSQAEGVSLVRASGGRDRLVEIELKEDQIVALGLTPSAISQAIESLDLVREAGAVREDEKQWTVTIRNRPTSAQAVRDAVILSRGRVVRVSDIAQVWDTYEEAQGYFRIDGRPAVGFQIYKEIGSNTVEVAEAVKARMELLEPRLPLGTEAVLEYDQSVDVKKQLTDLRYRAVFAALVIFLVLLSFLRSFRSAAVVFTTIAFSILIALNLIYFGGLSLNILTLMGLAMGFGLIVDNSIVVLENVFRRWQAGEAPMRAAEEGARQVVLPILAATATTLIVFVPFVYLQGELRVYYVPLAIVVGLTLLASLFVAFSFIPALAGRILGERRGSGLTWTMARIRGGGGSTRASAEREPSRESSAPPGDPPIYMKAYSGLLGVTLRWPWAPVLFAGVCLWGSSYVFKENVQTGIYWGGGGGQDTFVRINITLPRGSDLERTDELARFFEERLAALPEVEKYTTQVTGTNAYLNVTFPDSLEYTSVPPAIKEQMVAYSLQFSGADVRVYGFGPSFYGGGGSPPNYRIQVLGYNYEEVRDIAEDLGQRLMRMPRIREVDTNSSGSFTRDRATEFVVEIDRDALARYDMTTEQFVSRMNAVISGQTGTTLLKIAGEEVRFEVKVEGFRYVDLRDLQETIVTGPSGVGIRIGDVVTINSRRVLARIQRENQQYERTVAYEFLGPPRYGDVVRDAVVNATDLPPGYTIEDNSGWRWSDEERDQIYFILAVSVLLVYMVTAALFESLKQPLCVLLTVPMALIGVFLIFFFWGATFTREAYIGVIMMGGIAVNNSILLVDHINQVRREAGLGFHEAVLKGTLERVRPILMTTATTVLGLLPLVLFSQTADANIWNAPAYALIGGLLSSTLFVLTTTPALYVLFEGNWARRGSA